MPARAPAGSTLRLEKKLIWEQEEQILDVVMLAGDVLVLSPSGVGLHGSREEDARLTPLRAWPRDLRGHLRGMKHLREVSGIVDSLIAFTLAALRDMDGGKRKAPRQQIERGES